MKLEPIVLNQISKALAITIILIFSLTSCSNKLMHLIEKDEILKPIMANQKEYEVQIRYTQIDRDMNGHPKFKSYNYCVDNNEYFYPASTAKMPVAIIALQQLRKLQKETGKAIDVHTTIHHYASKKPQSDCTFDALANGPPNIANYIDQLFCISDNNANNRLFELSGAQYLNEELYKKGAFTSSRIVHRLGVTGYDVQDHHFLNEIHFLDEKGKLIHKIEARKSVFNYHNQLKNTLKGRAYIDNEDSLINRPFDFSKKNFVSITDLENCIKRVLFPEAFKVDERFEIEKDDYHLLYHAMRSLPKEIPYFANDSHFYDNYVKYYFDGDSTSVIPDNLKIMNKVGWAYGYLTDCSYIFDTHTGMEFLLTATIKVNKDGVFNDGIYEYEEIGLPFFRSLGKRIIEYEQNRPRKYKANFNRYLD